MSEETVDKVTEVLEVVEVPEEDDTEFREAPTQPVRIFELLDTDAEAPTAPRARIIAPPLRSAR